MMNSSAARAFDQWCSAISRDNAMARKERGWKKYTTLRKLTRAWRRWMSNAHEQVARGRIRDTFRFSKAQEEV